MRNQFLNRWITLWKRESRRTQEVGLGCTYGRVRNIRTFSYWLSYWLEVILSWENNPMKCHHSPGKRFGQKCATFLTSLVKSHKSPFSFIIRKKNMFFQQHTIQGLGAFVLNTPFSKGIMLLRHAEIVVSGVLGWWWWWWFGFGLGRIFWGGQERKWVESQARLPNRSRSHDLN